MWKGQSCKLVFFSDSVWVINYYDLVIRMVLACVLGGLIGIEREWGNHAAGFRTHILVCIGSATIMLLSIYGFSQFVDEENVRIDPARLAAQVISGIGFLGAGAILRNGNMVKGLTTAASIWVVAAIGLCVGAGFLVAAVICTSMVLISLYILNKWERFMLKNKRIDEIEIIMQDRSGSIKDLMSKLEKHGFEVADLKIEMNKSKRLDQRDTLRIVLSLIKRNNSNVMLLFDELMNTDSVLSLQTRHANPVKVADESPEQEVSI